MIREVREFVAAPTTLVSEASTLPTFIIYGASVSNSITTGPLTRNIVCVNALTPNFTFLPTIVVPPNGFMPIQPGNTTLIHLIQLGFLYPLNYPFVASNRAAIAQIFQHTLQGIAFALGLKESQITLEGLESWDTASSLGYNTTLIMAFIPTGLVNDLSLHIQNSSSAFYNGPSQIIRNLTAFVNPDFPILAAGELLSHLAAGAAADIDLVFIDRIIIYLLSTRPIHYLGL
ncbi:hypothetical protein MMC18_003691 [Xylographa bjoerkii]|nr:hypothetical protein [Xylographa bjoerkii]